MCIFITCVLLQVTNSFCFENIALHKPTWQEHPWPDYRFYRGENAVDGLFSDRSISGGQCTISANKKSTATWRVDLGRVVSISHVKIYYRTDNDPNPVIHKSRMAGFYLYVSKTTSKKDGHLCFHENNTKYGMLSEDQRINCSVHGRFVIYYNERIPGAEYPNYYSPFAYNELCEVEVYGCSDFGVYGGNCSLMCPTNCNERQCDINKGHCLSCIEGYQGQKCDIRTSRNSNNNDETTGPGIIYIIGGIIAAAVVVNSIVIVTVVYKRKLRLEQMKTRRTKEKLILTATKTAIPKSRLYSLHMCLNVDLEEGLAQPGFSNSPSKQSDDIKKVNQNIDLNDDDEDFDEKINEENPYGDLHDNEKPIPDVSVDNLRYVIEENSRNEDDGFKKNYATLLYGEMYACNIGKLPENIPKNRFKTTFPYDHSRVKLTNKESDYINANYIDSVCKENVYIASQGPTQNTVGDFWLMVWQEHIEQVVMLTNLMEGSKTKCFKYWSDLEETMSCDMFTLHTTKERHYACYSIREMRVTYNTKNEIRTVTQYHYTAWPDHGTPDPLCILMFHNHVTRTRNPKYKVPTLVHCSAGIGRTGTYIAIDALYEEGLHTSKINIAEYVKKMREKRMNMVQTYEQYKTIFLTLHEMFQAPLVLQKANDYLLKLQAVKMDHPSNPLFREEFQKLLSVRRQYSERDYKMAMQFESVSRAILPLDKYVLFLTSSVLKRGNYINAISLPSFTSQDAFIITHYTTIGNAVDFIRLITDYESEVVVSMEPLCNIESQTDEWLPTATGSRTVTPYKIHQQEESTTEIKCTKLEIANSSHEVWLVQILEPLCTLTQDNPQTASQIMALVSFVQTIETHHPITIVSSDGAALCGVFCAVYNLIQQLTMDEEVDVFSVVRLLQTRRPELCDSMEEYAMINDALLRFLK